MKQLEDTLHIASLGGSGVEFAIAVGACTAFAETIVGLRIYDAFFVHSCEVAAAGAHVFAALEYYWFITQCDESQRRK